MKNVFIKKLIDKTFEIVILLKSFFGFFEILAGIVIAFSGKLMVDNLIIALTRSEIKEDPKDFIANFFIKAGSGFSGGVHTFAFVYLIFHGIINISLAIALLKNKIWAYPWAIAGFSLFILYQLYRYANTHSPLLLILTAFDTFIVLVISVEYKKKKIIKLVNDGK